ncbi:hypothetical protein NQ317_017013 [Molorchus minor]|uniref:Uncharacterized protein n=1 Tax=Molorchus minor TaxID=1323400 RepID=A0ABQ9J0U1_9CUCU|nr:hypothetical protein NQ317_017013 [Molorchus minor]
MDQERVRLTREEDLYKQEMLRLETDLGDLESTVEELRGNVINRKTRVNMSDVENMALVLSKSSKTVADLKLRFPGLQDGMKAFFEYRNGESCARRKIPQGRTGTTRKCSETLMYEFVPTWHFLIALKCLVCMTLNRHFEDGLWTDSIGFRRTSL